MWKGINISACVCVCVCATLCCLGAAKTGSSAQPVMSLGFIRDERVKVKAQRGQDPGNSGSLEWISEALYDLYRPVGRYLLSPKLGVSGTGEENIFQNGPPLDRASKPDLVDRMSSSLQAAGQGGNVSIRCVNDTGRLIVGLFRGAGWAVQFLDASGKPGAGLTLKRWNLVGDFRQCRAAMTPPPTDRGRQFSGNYCLVGLTTGNPLLTVQWGVCLPSTCTDRDVSHIARGVVEAVGVHIPARLVGAECLTAPTQVTTAAVLAVVLLTVVTLLMVIGTSHDILLPLLATSDKPTQELSGIETSTWGSLNADVNSDQSDIADHGHPAHTETTFLLRRPQRPTRSPGKWHGALTKVLRSFSVYSNGKKILSTSQAQGSLAAIHGIRFLSMSWVVLGHFYKKIPPVAENVASMLPEFSQRWSSQVIGNALPSVDSFFALSGLLTSYLTIREMKRQQTWRINWPMFYFHRFWRLTPPYMSVLLISLGLTQYCGQGPLWHNTQPVDREACEQNWWTNLLYVNNLVHPYTACLTHSWYLANDMQFFVLSPLMLVPFYFHRLAGLLSCSLFLLVHWITTGALSIVHRWPNTLVTMKPVPGRAGQMEWFTQYYIVPWCRIGPFVVGILAGYVLAVTKGRPFRMPRWLVASGWIVTIASSWAVVFGLRGDITGDHPSSLATAALYNAVSRSVWGACVCWVVVACAAGYGGPVNALLSWSPFAVLGRLTYMTYLIHLPLMYIFFQSLGTLVYLDDKLPFIMFLGFLLFTNMASFVAVLALELPTAGLEKALLRKERH